MKKDRIYKILYAVSVVLLVIFVIMLGVDYSRYRTYSAPFYIYVVTRAVEFVIPSIIVFVAAKVMEKRVDKNN